MTGNPDTFVADQEAILAQIQQQQQQQQQQHHHHQQQQHQQRNQKDKPSHKVVKASSPPAHHAKSHTNKKFSKSNTTKRDGRQPAFAEALIRANLGYAVSLTDIRESKRAEQKFNGGGGTKAVVFDGEPEDVGYFNADHNDWYGDDDDDNDVEIVGDNEYIEENDDHHSNIGNIHRNDNNGVVSLAGCVCLGTRIGISTSLRRLLVSWVLAWAMGHAEPLGDRHISSGHSSSGSSSARGRASSSSSSSSSSNNHRDSSNIFNATFLVAHTEGQVTALLEYGIWLVNTRRLDLVVAFIRAIRQAISIITSKTSTSRSTPISLSHIDMTAPNDTTYDDTINSNVMTSNRTNGANHTDDNNEDNTNSATIKWWQETGKFLEQQIQEKVIHEYGVMIKVD